MKNLYKYIFLFLYFLSNLCFATYFDAGTLALWNKNYSLAEEMFKYSYLYEDNPEESLMFLGHTYFLQNKYNLAKKCYEEVIKNYSITSNEKNLYNISKFLYAESCVYLKDYSAAKEVYSELFNVNEKYLLPYILYGKIYTLFQLEEYGSVLTNISYLREQLKTQNFVLEPKIDEQLLFILSETWFRKGCLKEAEREYKKFVSLYKESEYFSFANLRLTQILTEQKKYSSAEAILNDISLEKVSKDTEIMIKYYIGKLLLKQNKFSSAIKLYTELIKTAKGSILEEHIKYDTAFCYYKLGEYKKSLELLSELRNSQIQDISVNSLYLSGLVSFSSEKYDEAIKIFLKLLSSSSQVRYKDEIYYWLGLSYINSKKYKEAIKVLKNLANKKSSIYSLSTEFFIARCYIYLKEYELAKKMLTELLDKPLDKKFKSEVIYELGKCYKLSGEYDIAEQYYIQLINQYPEKSVDAKLSLCDVYIRQGKFNQAEEILKTVLTQQLPKSNYKTAKILLFEVKYFQKKYKDTLDIANELSSKFVLNLDEKKFLYPIISKIYLNEMNYPEAIKYLKLSADLSTSAEEKFVLKLKIAKLLFSIGKDEDGIKQCNILISEFPKPEYLGAVWYTLLQHYVSISNHKEIRECLSKLKSLKNIEKTLSLLSKDEIVNLIDLSLVYDMEFGLYIAEHISHLSHFSPADIVYILSKVIDKTIEEKKFTSGLKLISVMRQIVSDHNSLIYTEYLAGKIYHSMERTVQAENIYKTILEKYADRPSQYIPKVYIGLINIYNSRNDVSNVNRYEDILISKYGDSEDTYKYMFDTATKLESEKNYTGAIKRYSFVTNSKNVELQAISQKKLGDCYYHLGRYKEASVEYLKTVYLYPQYSDLCAEAQFMVGLCCEHLKLYDEAKKAYNSSKRNYPGTLWAQEAELKLKFLK